MPNGRVALDIDLQVQAGQYLIDFVLVLLNLSQQYQLLLSDTLKYICFLCYCVFFFKPKVLYCLYCYYYPVKGLNKIAKKLNLDCVPAMVGWDQKHGFSIPLYVSQHCENISGDGLALQGQARYST